MAKAPLMKKEKTPRDWIANFASSEFLECYPVHLLQGALEEGYTLLETATG